MIRDALETDSTEIAEIYNHYIQKTVITFEEKFIDALEITARIRKVQSAGYSWLVAIDNERIIGYAYSSKWNERAAYKNTAEVSIYVAHDVTKSGWGTKLYSELFSRLRNNSIHIAIGGITLPNPASIALHEKFGMEKVAHFKQVGYKFNQWLDVGYWQVQLST